MTEPTCPGDDACLWGNCEVHAPPRLKASDFIITDSAESRRLLEEAWG